MISIETFLLSEYFTLIINMLLGPIPGQWWLNCSHSGSLRRLWVFKPQHHQAPNLGPYSKAHLPQGCDIMTEPVLLP